MGSDSTQAKVAVLVMQTIFTHVKNVCFDLILVASFKTKIFIMHLPFHHLLHVILLEDIIILFSFIANLSHPA